MTRRAVVVASVPDRLREVFAWYGGMNVAVDEILGGYSDGELAVVIDFLQLTTHAGRAASDQLAGGDDPGPRSAGS